MLHHLFDLLGPPKVAEPLGRSLRPPLLLLLARGRQQRKRDSERESQDINSDLSTSVQLRQYRGLLHSLDLLHQKPRRTTSSVCEDCEDDCRTPNSTPDLPRSFTSAGRRDRANGSKRGTTSGRRRSVSWVPGGSTSGPDPLLPEEVTLHPLLPLTNNTSTTPTTTTNFQRIKRQLSTNHGGSRSSVGTGSPGGRMGDLARSGGRLGSAGSHGEVGRGPLRCPSRCGGWVRTFPFNATTLHASREPRYNKTLVAELTKYRRTCEKVFRENPHASDQFLDDLVHKILWKDNLIWTPKI